MRARLALVALAVAIAAGLGLLPVAASPALAATPELTLVTDARYVVDPDDARVHVTVDITATNHKPDTPTRRYYFDQAYLAVLPGTTDFTITAAGSTPTLKVTEQTGDHTLVRIAFGTRILSGRSLDLRLSFDLPDPGGQPARDVRIGQALTQFPIWAFASDGTPGSTVEVVIPSGFAVHFAAGAIPGPTEVGDTLVYRTGPLDSPTTFFAYLVADREGAYAERALEIEVGETSAAVAVRAWADDAAFSERVSDLLTRGLPQLGDAIGLEYPRHEPLVVQESVSRSLGGYAGLFDPADGRISVDYAAPAFVVLHEAAHVWFNGTLLADRWANEAFASYYAERVAGKLDLAFDPDRLTPELEAARIPLNAWGTAGGAEELTESYGYAASLALAELVAERAGDPALSRVWAAAAERRSAYQPVARSLTPETVAGPPDWRGLLDLLEETTDRPFDDLWRTWVIRDSDLAALDQRAIVRAQYRATLERARDWELPETVRQALSTWQFDAAAGQLAQAGAVLAKRDEIAARADRLRLSPPSTLEEIFEGTAGLRAASIEADAELAAIDAYVAAVGTRLVAPGPIEQLGLLGSEPALDLAAARERFAAGDLVGSVAAADDARTAWESADEVGLRRALTVLGGTLVVGLVVLLVVLGLRGRHVVRLVTFRHRPGVPMAHPIARRIADRAGNAGGPAAEDQPSG